MSKYFDTKPGSLEEAVSAAQQAAIAISKKERGEKPKNEKDEDASQFAFVAKKAKEDGEKTFMFAGKKYDTETEEVIKEETLDEKVEYVEYKFKNKNDAMAAKKMLDGIQLMSFDINDDNISNGELMVDAGSKDMTKYHKEIMKKFRPKVMTQEGYTGGATGGMMGNYKKGAEKKDKENMKKEEDKLDPVNPKAVKKKFADRKDKDIDNDGDVDDSDKFLHKRRKAVSKAMGEEITEEEFEMMIETLTELSPALLKRARDAARAKSQRADDRSMKMRKLGKGDSDLTKKLDKETDKRAAQARKFDRAADDAKYDRMDKAADKLDKGPKSKNPDVDDYGRTKADKVRDGNVKSKDAEKIRRRDAAAGQKQGKGSLGATDRNVAKQGDAYSKYQAKGGKLSRTDYLKRFGKSIKREDFETDAEWEAHLMEMHRTLTPLKDTILNMWKEAQDMENDKDGDGMDDDQKPKKTTKKTDSGKDMTPVELSPKKPKLKNEKNKV